jgi:hypothetical protein
MNPLFPVFWQTATGANRSGYINPQGHLQVELPYLRVGPSSDGFAFYTDGIRWSKGILWGIMLENGDSVVCPRFTSHQSFVDKLAVAAENDAGNFSFRFGYVDHGGSWRIKPQFLAAKSFSEGAAYAKSGVEADLWSLYDAKGHLLADHLSLGGGYLREGLAQAYVPMSRQCGFVDITGDWKIPARFTCVSDFSEGLAAAWLGKPGKELLSYIDRTGATIIEPSVYLSCENGFAEGLACVYRPIGRKGDVLAGYIDRSGGEVIPCRWGLGAPFSEGLAAVKDIKSGLWGYIDTKGEIVIQPKYGAAAAFSGGLARVRVLRQIGPEDYINTAGEIVWKSGTKPEH